MPVLGSGTETLPSAPAPRDLPARSPLGQGKLNSQETPVRPPPTRSRLGGAHNPSVLSSQTSPPCQREPTVVPPPLRDRGSTVFVPLDGHIHRVLSNSTVKDKENPSYPELGHRMKCKTPLPHSGLGSINGRNRVPLENSGTEFSVKPLLHRLPSGLVNRAVHLLRRFSFPVRGRPNLERRSLLSNSIKKGRRIKGPSRWTPSPARTLGQGGYG